MNFLICLLFINVQAMKWYCSWRLYLWFDYLPWNVSHPPIILLASILGLSTHKTCDCDAWAKKEHMHLHSDDWLTCGMFLHILTNWPTKLETWFSMLLWPLQRKEELLQKHSTMYDRCWSLHEREDGNEGNLVLFLANPFSCSPIGDCITKKKDWTAALHEREGAVNVNHS